MLLAADPDKFFTEPHYNGFPAVLVRLPAIDTGELAELITDAWRCQAPHALVAGLGRSPRLGHGEAYERAVSNCATAGHPAALPGWPAWRAPRRSRSGQAGQRLGGDRSSAQLRAGRVDGRRLAGTQNWNETDCR
jgi:hypothetical protein